ncbi:MAG: prephenate dehydrogenase/arogenate dehydrogenase family protein [Thermoanaerobaculia bacterium]
MRKPKRRAKRTLLLVGGAGRMGRLFARFFRRKGFAVRVADPAGAPRGFPVGALDDVAEADVVLIAASLENAAAALAAVLDRNPKGLVFDIASLKTPLLPLFARARKEGVAIASAHPMFGPDARFFGRDFLVCDVGDVSAVRRVTRLFAGAGLKIRTMPAAEHDRWVGRTMGLAHLVALVSAFALAELGVSRDDVDGRATTSFRHLLALVAPILDQDPALTRAIQAANPEALFVFERLADQVDALRSLLFGDDACRLEARLGAVRAALR